MSHPLHQLGLDELRKRASLKWRAYPPEVIPAWVAEMDVTLAPAVTHVLQEVARSGDTGYAYGDGYASAFANFAEQRWGWRVELARTRLVPDVMLGVLEVLRLVTSTGDAVIVNCPVYPPFYNFVRHLGRQVIEAPLSDEYRIDADVLESAFVTATAGGRAAAYLLCNPHNPTGTVHTAEELSTVASLADRYGVRVVADEIHGPLVYPHATFTPYLSQPVCGSGFAVVSASKAWNLAGLKTALVIAGEAAAADLAQMPEEVGHGASHVAVLAHVAALRDGRGWLDDLLADLDANRLLLARLLDAHLPAIRYRPPAATYLAWLDCRDLGLGDNPAQTFLRRGRVALTPGPGFGAGSAGHARLNFATSPELLTEIVTRMAKAVAEPDAPSE